MKRVTALGFTLLALFSWASLAQAQQCTNTPASVALIAKSSINAGTVTVSNDRVNLYVRVAATGDWTISQIDVDAALSLAGLHGTNVAAYPYRTTLNPAVASYTFAIPLGSFQIGNSLFLAVHARLKSHTLGTADSWGAGTLFPGSKVCGTCTGDDDGEEGDHHDDGGSYNHTSGHSTVNLHASHSSDGSGDGEDDCDDDGEHHDSGSSYHSTSGHSMVSLHGNGSSGSGDDHHGDDHHGDDHHGDDHHDDGGSSGGCGATYFTYLLTCGGGPVE